MQIILKAHGPIKCKNFLGTLSYQMRYILHIDGFGLCWFALLYFYDISTIVGYLMPNSFLYV